MDLEQPCGIGGSLVALRYHFADFSLLLKRQLRMAAAYAPLFTGGIQSGFGSLFTVSAWGSFTSIQIRCPAFCLKAYTQGFQELKGGQNF